MTRRRALVLFPLALASLAASHVPWEEMTEADWIYALATRYALVEGHRVHYPTPPLELARLLEERSEAAALRQLAEAKNELGDRSGALSTLERWAEREGPPAWAETARWAASHQEMATAFRAAERALPGLPHDTKRALADERIAWAEQHPDLADPIDLRKARAQLFPEDPQAVEDWLRALVRATRLAEADQGVAGAPALTPERRLLLRSDLLAAHGDHLRAFQVLDAAVAEPWSIDFRRAYARRLDRAAVGSLESWRGILDAGFDPAALLRLATAFEGQGRGDAAADLLRQMERRYEGGLDRRGQLLLARLHGEIDAVPEAFRATLAAAHLGSPGEQIGDLAALARLALKAGGRPLAWGSYNDEAYRWVARLDRTPGFWTGGASFLVTGQDWKEALARLESESLPDRTFLTARALLDELLRRSPEHAELPALRAAIMERYVERGEGRAALALLPLIEAGSPAAADEGRRIALLAARQVELPLAEELRLFKARLRFRAADGSRPALEEPRTYYGADSSEESDAAEGLEPWAQVPPAATQSTYRELLEDALTRLESRDLSHRTSLDLVLTEMDRLPDAESLWLELASRLEGWNLDDELGPRYERALTRFEGPGIWARSARWYARRSRHADLQRLAGEIAARFRGAAIFEKVLGAGDVRVEIPEQPPLGSRVRLVAWGDWVRLKALERFPHSSLVFREAGRLVTETAWKTNYSSVAFKANQAAPVVVSDSLLEERRWALLFADASVRENHLAGAMQRGTLEKNLVALEGRSDRTPVEDLLLFDGWARLSRFEQAIHAADRLAASYPGDGPLAQRVLTLHRSLNGLDAAQVAQARALVERTAPALVDAAPLWTDLGELEEDRGRSQSAMAVWQHLVDREPRNPQRISELATLLWDYNHDAEALKVVEEGRKRMNRPRFFAFEAGVLRENVKDVEGAVREYLDAVWPEGSECFCSWFERDQRSLRRLAQLLSRPRVFGIVEQRIGSLTPGLAGDEKALSAFFPLAGIEPPDPGLDADADDWIDALDMPNDPRGRAQREAQRDQARPQQYDGIRRIGDVMLEKTQAMVAKATALEFLEAAENWSRGLLEARWQPERVIDFRAALLARRAELAPSEEERIRLEVVRARFLVEHGRGQEADAVWAALDNRIGAMPEGAPKLRAEAERAGYVERAKGNDDAAAEWQRIGDRYPWSLGLLEDRLSFLNRAGRGGEARALLEKVVPKAGSGHRQALLERLTRDALTASDLPRARRAVEALLAEDSLQEHGRISAIHLLTRLSLKESAAFDPFPLAKAEAVKLKTELHPDLYQQMARAADLEQAWGTAMSLWIEALNRRTERDWLQAACASASRAAKRDELLGFFEKQQARSPRDVRWAVAVRDIKRAYHQVDGAIEAARAAVAVRPDWDQLWREAAELMVRADRIREAADYLEGWNRPRPADEGVAGWRSGLYARVGDGSRALAVEQAALAAYAKEAPNGADGQREQQERQARAAERLLDYGYPDLALGMYSAKGDVRQLAGSRLSALRQCEIALLNNQFLRLLNHRAGDSDFRAVAASFFERHARPENKEELQTFLLRQIFPAGASEPSPKGLDRWWPFLTRAGVERAIRVAMAERLLAVTPGPWFANPPFAFLDRVGGEMIQQQNSPFGAERVAFVQPDLDRLWTLELLRQDRADDVLTFLEPRWQDLLARVRGSARLSPASDRLPWASWLDDPQALATWARAAESRPEKLHEIAAIMTERRLWDRFWVLAARQWQVAPLVALLPAEPRTAWFRFWEPTPERNPVLMARREAVEKASNAVGRLLQGLPQAAADPLMTRLRGPDTVGEVLGRDSRWTWPEFTPRQNAQGESIETGDDRVIGQRTDQGRLPGALWGDRPGQAWYVLEALARYRQADKTSPLIPTEVPERGGETSRALLSIRLAQSLGDLPLAMELAAEFGGPAQDPGWLSGQLRLLVAAGRKDQATASFQKFLRGVQATLTEDGFRSLNALAEDLGLPSPLEGLDQGRPVGPVFLAYLHDRRGDLAPRFHTGDPVGFRTALANRWAGRESELTTEQILFWLKELWAKDSAALPERALAKLGGLWPHAAAWFSQQPAQDRLSALEAIERASGVGALHPRLLALASWQADDVGRLLAIRIHLVRSEGDQALALADQMLKQARGGGQALSLGGPETDSAETASGEGEEEDMEPASPPAPRPASSGDALVDRLRAWLRPFRDAGRAAVVEERFRALLQERREAGLLSAAGWRLAFELTPPSDRPGLAQALEEAWFRGQLAPEDLGVMSDTLARWLPAEAPRWLARWPQKLDFGQVRQRAAVLMRLKDPAAAAQVIFEARRSTAWPSPLEEQAFDFWRQLGSPTAVEVTVPAGWAAALPFWRMKAEAVLPGLGDHLKVRRFDVLASRAAFRSPAPASEESLLRVAMTRQGAGYDHRREPDLAFLRLRAARGLLPRSAKAARVALGALDGEAMTRDLVHRRLGSAVINAALADLARLTAKSGEEGQLKLLLARLDDRKADNAVALRAELLADRPAKPEAYRMVNGQPAPIRPRDLTWSMLDQVLQAEGVR